MTITRNLAASHGNYYKLEAYLRSDYSLGVGSTLMTDFVSMAYNSTYANEAGLMLAMTDTMETNSPTAGYYDIKLTLRRKYSSTNGYNCYFYYPGGSYSVASISAPDGLYVTRTAANTYVAGYYVGDVFTALGTYTASGTGNQAQNPGAAIGYYADTRFTTAVEVFDNFRLDVVPEPSTLVLLGMGAVGLLAYAWRKRR